LGTITTFPATQGNRLRITLTRTVDNGPAWSMQDLRVLALK
jgi:hypothetical protein